MQRALSTCNLPTFGQGHGVVFGIGFGVQGPAWKPQAYQILWTGSVNPWKRRYSEHGLNYSCLWCGSRAGLHVSHSLNSLKGVM